MIDPKTCSLGSTLLANPFKSYFATSLAEWLSVKVENHAAAMAMADEGPVLFVGSIRRL
jgi:hypothetical protein